MLKLVRNNPHVVHDQWQIAPGTTGLQLGNVLTSTVVLTTSVYELGRPSAVSSSELDGAYVFVHVDRSCVRAGGGQLAKVEVRGTSPEHAARVMDRVRELLPEIPKAQKATSELPDLPPLRRGVWRLLRS